MAKETLGTHWKPWDNDWRRIGESLEMYWTTIGKYWLIIGIIGKSLANHWTIIGKSGQHLAAGVLSVCPILLPTGPQARQKNNGAQPFVQKHLEKPIKLPQ